MSGEVLVETNDSRLYKSSRSGSVRRGGFVENTGKIARRIPYICADALLARSATREQPDATSCALFFKTWACDQVRPISDVCYTYTNGLGIKHMPESTLKEPNNPISARSISHRRAPEVPSWVHSRSSVTDCTYYGS